MIGHVALAGRIGRAVVQRPPRPYKLTYATTYGCNSRCQTCGIWERTPTGELSLDEVRRFFDQNRDFSWIDFTGGEPWLRRDFVEIVQSAIESCRGLLLVHFATNGWLTDLIVDGVRRICESRPRKFMVTVSLDGDADTNDRVRGMPGGWERQVATYERLHALDGVEVVLGMTLSTHNVSAYPDALAAVQARCPWVTARDFHLNVVHHSAHFYGNDDNAALRSCGTERLAEAMTLYRRARGPVRSVVDLLEQEYLRRVPAYLSDGQTPMRCHALRSSCFLDPTGTVYPCITFDRPLGNIRDHGYSLAAVWEAELTRQTQADIWAGRCPSCWTPCEAYPTLMGHVLGLVP